jgi:chromosome segregation ATPase
VLLEGDGMKEQLEKQLQEYSKSQMQLSEKYKKLLSEIEVVKSQMQQIQGAVYALSELSMSLKEQEATEQKTETQKEG